MKKDIAGKRVFITGVCGTVGRELCRQLLETYQVDELIGIDNNESELFFLEQRFSDFSNAHFYLADIRDTKQIVQENECDAGCFPHCRFQTCNPL
jgi:FlaA1/EpsC-like NDP-sugar epimerase